MRVLVLAPQPFFVPRGTPIAVRALLQVLSVEGHDCDVLVYAEGTDPGIERVRLHRLPALPGTRNMPPGFSLKKVICDAVMLPMAAWRMLRGKYDLVIAVEEAAFIALMLKPFFRVPYLYDVDSSIPEQMDDKFDLPGWLRRLLEGAEARAARGSIGAITCCRALQDLVEGYAPGLPVQTLEDVTLVTEALPEAAPEDCSFDEPVVMYIGNLESYQGVGLLIEGFARAISDGHHARLVIIGGSETHVAEHRALAEQLGVADQVSLLGPRPVERIGEYLAQASIVVSPRTQGRNTPMKVYSYLDSGSPLLATRLPTHTQVLDDEISILVAPEAADMARGIGTLLSDPALRARLAEAAQDRVRREFSPEAYARKLTGFMSEQILPKLAPTTG
ncbi:glycosyltransferase family 4 protein [Ruegeria sp. 2012CJ41-6]|uniref:Glycosyltransferase family 4 protein n=1 Tax=Ruegeria spongiae TaxID=2942209 RepID=A0ABT0Q718_9RHOB|nr:glycosyltransferase family 4 protein [Ruegeria spongiae]MCL6285633.1 glycosyltransferase family 4 protein [Ruegeria spongiae]